MTTNTEIKQGAGELPQDAALPCPFCAALPLIQEHEPHRHGLSFGNFVMPDHPGSFTLECPTEGCCAMIADTKAEVLAAWNRRAQRAASVPVDAAQPVALRKLSRGEIQAIEDMFNWHNARSCGTHIRFAYAMIEAMTAAPVPAASVQAETITLTGHQLRIAADFINPDGLDERDQLDDDLTFGVRQHQDDDGKISTGMCCWNDDTDGVLPLDGEYEAATVPQDIGRDAALEAEHDIAVLLRLRTPLADGNNVHMMLTKRRYAPLETLEDLNSHDEFLYNEHTCPTNWLGVATVLDGSDPDPHGVFEHVQTIEIPMNEWGTCRVDIDECDIAELFDKFQPTANVAQAAPKTKGGA